MKHLGLLMLVSVVILAGCDPFNEQFTLALNMEPVTKTYGLNPGGTSFTNPATPYNLNDYVDEAYLDDITGGGIYDIGVRLSPAHTGRTVSGQVTLSYGGNTATVSYSGSWDQLTTERTVVRDPTLVTIDNPTAFNNLVNAVFSQNPLPTITLSGSGSSSQTITSGDSLTVSIYGQAATAITL